MALDILKAAVCLLPFNNHNRKKSEEENCPSVHTTLGQRPYKLFVVTISSSRETRNTVEADGRCSWVFMVICFRLP